MAWLTWSWCGQHTCLLEEQRTQSLLLERAVYLTLRRDASLLRANPSRVLFGELLRLWLLGWPSCNAACVGRFCVHPREGPLCIGGTEAWWWWKTNDIDVDAHFPRTPVRFPMALADCVATGGSEMFPEVIVT